MNPNEFTAAQAADPTTPLATLADVATHRPDLRAAVASNPSAYPELLDWLRGLGDPAVVAVIDRRRASGAPAVPAPPVPLMPPVPPGPAAYAAQPPVGAPSTAEVPGGAPAYGQHPSGFAAPQSSEHVPAQAQVQTPSQQAWAQQASAQVQGAPYQAGYQEAAPAGGEGTYGAPEKATARKSRRGMWIGIGAVTALVLGGAAFAANALWFSKVGGADTPEAAVTQLVEGAAKKDLVAMYGVTSPADLSVVTTAGKIFEMHFADSQDLAQDSGLSDAMSDYVDALDLTLSDLAVESEELEPGLAKVTLTSGSLVLDADVDAVVKATVTLFETFESTELGQQAVDSGALMPTEAEIRDAVEGWMADELPVTVTTDDLVIEREDMEGVFGERIKAESIGPFLVAVEEGGSWYVSPYLTILEYAASLSGLDRGSLPQDSAAGAFSSPEDAAAGLVSGFKDYLATGSPDELGKALPLADRRALSLYADISEIDDPDFAAFQDELKNIKVDASYSVREQEGDIAWLTLDDLEISGVVSGTPFVINLDSTCISGKADRDTFEACLDQVPLLEELGIGDLALVAVKEDGSWYISGAGTYADATGVITVNVQRLMDEGKFEDPEWLEENLGDLVDSDLFYGLT